MRNCPAHVAKALRSMDSGLSLRWDGSLHAWFFHHRDRRMFKYVHDDGTPVTDPVASEAVEILRRSYIHRADLMLREMDANRRRRLDRFDSENEKLDSERIAESRKVIACAARGAAKPFMQPLGFAPNKKRKNK